MPQLKTSFNALNHCTGLSRTNEYYLDLESKKLWPHKTSFKAENWHGYIVLVHIMNYPFPRPMFAHFRFSSFQFWVVLHLLIVWLWFPNWFIECFWFPNWFIECVWFPNWFIYAFWLPNWFIKGFWFSNWFIDVFSFRNSFLDNRSSYQ